ncbi:SIMPL domain-containing protein [Asticcacaulis sp.]|uniref:SIMPL domain-containing protein n=1 Tax=Asticcacaulis sp. TaxID=1872648 RepID=UPI00391C7F61
MRRVWIGLCALPLLAAGAEAAPPVKPVETSDRFDAAPWWMERAVLPQTGYAETEVEANRATFAARFKGTGKTASEAQRQAVAQAETLIAALRQRPAEAVRVRTDFAVQAFYEQYRDKDGRQIANVRGDKIRGYDATLTLRVEVRDMAVLEPVYALVLAAAPTQVDRVAFALQPDNALRDRLRNEATRDAAVRAQGAVEATGSTLGGIRLIDPSGRACRADILGRRPDANADLALTGKRVEYKGPPQMVSGPSSPPPPLYQLEARAAENAFIQTPPLYRVQVQTCVVYDLK